MNKELVFMAELSILAVIEALYRSGFTEKEVFLIVDDARKRGELLNQDKKEKSDAGH